MPLLVRTWNVFHGNSHPPQRRAFLREMVELATADEPDVVCLQELPVWALGQLEAWSSMRAVSAVARAPLLPATLAERVTGLHHGVLRSAFTGEADAILVAARFEVDEVRERVVGRAKLRRIAQTLRLDRDIHVVNFHVDGDPAQLERAAALAPQSAPAIVAGDANIPGASLAGFSPPLPGSIDQILVRGLPASPPRAWPEEKRRVGNRLLSDHAPVELLVG